MKALAVALCLAFASVSYADDPAPSCDFGAGHVPRPMDPVGSPDASIPVEHVIVIVQENHSFDNVLGKLTDPRYYGDEVDGIQPGQHNEDASGHRYEPFHLSKLCIKDMDHSWDGSHHIWNGGLNDGFIRANDDSKKHNGYRAMGYYDDGDYPLMYFLADHYSVADRYFASVLSNTHPNRLYQYAATSFGRINNKLPNFFSGGWKQKTIFDQLNDAGVTWSYYQADYSNILLFTKMYFSNIKHFHHVSKFEKDASANKLPQVVFIENSTITGEEHPPTNFQLNQNALAKRLRSLMSGPSWDTSAVFITYDEGGGSWDHVPPPRACAPDSIPPNRDMKESVVAKFDRLGFRVPALVISPYAKRHHVSHVVYDHTSILKFIEYKFNVPALTARDANADPMLDMFDFDHPDFSRPALPNVPVQLDRLVSCVFKPGY